MGIRPRSSGAAPAAPLILLAALVGAPGCGGAPAPSAAEGARLKSALLSQVQNKKSKAWKKVGKKYVLDLQQVGTELESAPQKK
jgi:hypothetical protein